MACTQSLNECGGSASVITDKVTPSPRLAQHLNLTHNPRISVASQARDSQIDSESRFKNIDSKSESNTTKSHIDSESKTLTESTTPHNPNKALPDSIKRRCASTSRAQLSNCAIFAEQKSNKMCSATAQTTSRPLRGAQSLEKGVRSDSATIVLEAEKRGSPLDCRKSGDFFGAKGSGEGITPLFAKKQSNDEKLEDIRENATPRNTESNTKILENTKSSVDSKSKSNQDSQKPLESKGDSESKCATQEQQGGEVSEMNFVGYQARGAGSLLDINDQTPSVDSRESRSETSHTKNFHFRDIFGNYHRFFRPYTRTLPPLKVRAFAHAHCYSDSSEILITKSRKALISQTSYMTHEFAPPHAPSTLRKIFFVIKTCLKWLRFYTTRAQRIQGTIAIMHQSTNYFHYLVESVSSMLQITRSGLEVDYYVLDTSTPFAREMIELLQIPRDKILSFKTHRLLRADSLLLPTLSADVETIEYRDRLLFAHALSIPLNILDFYTRLSASSQRPTRKVFLTRPADSNRNIENLQEVQAVFGEFGYEIVLPDSLSLREQIALMRECKIIASMHGAGLANVLFAPSGAVVFEIFSEYYHDFGPQMCALLRKHRYMYMVGKTRDTSMHPQQENAYIHPEHLRHALKILEYESN